MSKRLLSLLLALTLCVGMFPVNAAAEEVEPTPEPSPVVTPEVSPEVSPVVSPEVSPVVSPEVSPMVSPEVSPVVSPEVSPVVSPEVSPVVSPEVSPSPAPSEAPLCSHEREEGCVLCALEAEIEALPSGEEWLAMSKEEQQTVYEAAQALADRYNALSEEEQALVSNLDKLIALHETFNSQVENDAVIAEGNCGEELYWSLYHYDEENQEEQYTLNITGSGDMYNYEPGTAPWFAYADRIQFAYFGGMGIKSVGDNAFYGCEKLLYVQFREGNAVSAIGQSAFEGCTSLSNLNIPAGVTQIKDKTFYGCSGLNRIGLPNNLSTIGEDAFYACSNLYRLCFPAGLSSIGNGAFRSCTGLYRIVFLGNAPSIAADAFSGVEYASVCYPDGNTSWNKDTMLQYGGELYWETAVMSGDYDGLNWELTDGTLYISGSGAMPEHRILTDGGYWSVYLNHPWYTYASAITAVVIGEGVTRIGSSAFAQLVNLNSISIPSSVTSIGDWAFMDCTVLKSASVAGNLDDMEIGEKNTALVKVLEHTHKVDKNYFRYEAQPATEGYPGNKAFTIPGCILCERQINSEGEVMSEEELIALWEKNTIYYPAANVVLARRIDEDAFEDVAGQTLHINMDEDSGIALSAYTEPDGADYRVKWSSSNKKVAKVDADGSVDFVKPGTVKITATSADGKASASVTLEITASVLEAELRENSYYGYPVAEGLQVGDMACIDLYFGGEYLDPVQDAEAFENLELFRILSGEAYVSIDAYGCLSAVKAGGTAKIEVSIPGDQLGRKVTLTIKTVAPQIAQIGVCPDAESGSLDENGFVSAEGLFVQNEFGDLEAAGESGNAANALYLPYEAGAKARSFAVKGWAETVFGENVELSGLLEWSSSNSAVASVKTNKDGTYSLTVKPGTKGISTLTATAASGAQAAFTVCVYDYTPILANNKLTMNSYCEFWYDAWNLDFILASGDEVQNVIPADDRLAVSYEGIYADPWCIMTNGMLPKSCTIKTELIVTTLSGEYHIPFTAVVKNELPPVTVKQTEKINRADLDSQGLLSIDSEYYLNFTSVTLDCEGYALGEALEGQNLWPIVHKAGGDPSKTKAILTVNVEGYAKPFTKNISIGTTNKALKASLSQSSLSLYTALPELEAETELSLNFRNESFDALAVVYTGKAAANVQVQADADGEITAALLPGAKTGTYKVQLIPTVNGDAMKAVSLSIKVNATLPKATLANSTVKLNLDYAGLEVASIPVKQNVADAELLGFREINSGSYANSDAVRLAYDEGVLTAMLTEKAEAKSYTIKLSPIFEDCDSEALSQVTLKVTGYKAKAEPTAKVSASGKLDSIQRGKPITYTLSSMSNISGQVQKVELIDASGIFEILSFGRNEKGKFTAGLYLQEDAACYTKQTYKIKLRFTLENGIQVETGELSVKIGQSALKLKAAVGTQTVYCNQSSERMVSFTIRQLSPADAQIAERGIKTGALVPELEEALGQVNYSSFGSSVFVGVTLDDADKLKPGKTYTIPVIVEAEGHAEDAKPTTVNLKLKVAK